MDGHGGINCMWVLHILIESPTYSIDCFQEDRELFILQNLNNHKIVT
jgi:hypothetical protein